MSRMQITRFDDTRSRRRTSQLAILIAFVFAILGSQIAAPTSASAAPGKPPDAAGVTEGVAKPSKVVIDWQMPARWHESWSSYGVVAAETTSAGTFDVYGYDPAYADPDSWEVILDGCATESAVRTVVWVWMISASGFARTVTSDSCSTTATVPTLGRYRVDLTVELINGGEISGESSIDVQDQLIVLLGDSSAAGEGNPVEKAVNSGLLSDPSWDDERCHRSRNAGAAEAARRLQDPHKSVTFLSFACSGAKLTTGVLFPYAGIDPPTDEPDLEPQLDQLVRALCKGTEASSCSEQRMRRVDKVFVQVGVNDLGFKSILLICNNLKFLDEKERNPLDIIDSLWLDKPCHDQAAVRGKVNSALAHLTTDYLVHNSHLMPGCDDEPDCGGIVRFGSYGMIGERLDYFNVDVEDYYLLTYPNGTFGDKDGSEDGCGAFTFVSKEESEWMKQVAIRLNELIRLEAIKLGGHAVTAIGPAFEKHGYCAGKRTIGTSPFPGDDVLHDRHDQSWFVPLLQSMLDQWNVEGTMHPNKHGHDAIADAVVSAVQASKPDRAPTHRVSIIPERIRFTEPAVRAGDNIDIALNFGFHSKERDSVTDELVDLFPKGRYQAVDLTLPSGEWVTLPDSMRSQVALATTDESLRISFSTRRKALNRIVPTALQLRDGPESDGPDVGPPDKPEDRPRVFSYYIDYQRLRDGRVNYGKGQHTVRTMPSIGSMGGTLEVQYCVLVTELRSRTRYLPPEQVGCSSVATTPGTSPDNRNVETAPTPECDGLAATILGSAGRDVLVGISGDDLIVGIDGNDVIRGLGGNDVIECSTNRAPWERPRAPMRSVLQAAGTPPIVSKNRAMPSKV